jgi:hypothetical protein
MDARARKNPGDDRRLPGILSAEESDIRPFSDDQNIVIGYACGDERTNLA